MRPLAFLTSMYLVGCSMAMATGDPSAMEIRNTTEVVDSQSLMARDTGDWPNGPYCARYKMVLRSAWAVRLPGHTVPKEIYDLCHVLWSELRNHLGCVVSSPHGCGAANHNSTVLHWNMHTSIWCKPEMVEGAIRGATNGKYGQVFCFDDN